MTVLYIITGILLLFSFIRDKQKTGKALKIAYKKFRKILPAFLIMLIMVSVVLIIFPEKIILKYLSNGNKYTGVGIASILGSITLMPGFIAFPLSGILRQQGVPYMVLSAFTTTLMMVGIITFPVEKEFFGVKVTLIRNVLSFIIAICVAAATGVIFGEIGI